MKLLMKSICLLLILTVLLTAVPLTAFADEFDDYTVTIDPFTYDTTYGDFSRYIDIEAEVNGEPVEGPTFTFDSFEDVITIRACLKEEWHDFPCHVIGMTMTYVDDDDDTRSQELDLSIINEYRDVETEFQHDGDVHISFTVDTVYKVLIEESEDGEITADRYRAREGDVVHVDVTPTNPDKPEYIVNVVDAVGRPVQVDNNESFVMPGGSTNVTVYAEYYSNACSYMYRWWDDEENAVLEEERWLTDFDNVVDMSTVSDGATLQDETWYYVKRNVTFSKRIYTDGHVMIILGDGATVNFKRGLEVSIYENLEVFDQSGGTGKLISTSERFAERDDQGEAAIGGDSNCTGGNMTFYGGNYEVKALTACQGAAIGGGSYGDGGCMTFLAGNYNIQNNGANAACIGGGYRGGACGFDNSGDGIRIYGGDFKMYSYSGGACIGNGKGKNGSVGPIVICGGTILAKGHNSCAGIGGGDSGSNGPIYISGGEITAIAYASKVTAAGIGSGSGADQGDTITITGGTVIAQSTRGAGIGGSCNHSGGSVRISGGTVFASSSYGGAGIGGGLSGSGGNVEVTGGYVVATSSLYDSTGEFTNTMTHYLSHVPMGAQAQRNAAAAIVTVSSLIDIFSDNEYSGAGIGGGQDGASGGSVSITGGTVIAECGLSSAQAIGKGKNGGSSGALNLGNLMKVTSGGSESSATLRTKTQRVSGCRNMYACIEPCDHPNHSYISIDENYHRLTCDNCTAENERLSHCFDDDGLICTDCGYERVRITFDPGDGSGEMDDAYVTKGEKYTLPGCDFTPPEGSTFYGWKGKLSGATGTYSPGSDHTISESLTLTAQWTNPYQLWVGGIAVTDANKDDILGDGEGKITYDPETGTLNFDDVTDPLPGQHSSALIYANKMDLTITGKATLTISGGFINGINVQDGTLTLNCDLTMTGNKEGNLGNAINATRDVIITGGEITVKGNNYGIRAGRSLYIRDTITRVTSDAVSYYSLHAQTGEIEVDPSLVVTEISETSRARAALGYSNARHIVIESGAVVTFKLNGGKWNNRTDDIVKTIPRNTTVEKPDPDPTRSQYIFGGWYEDENLTEEFDFTQPITVNTTLYAKWSRTFNVEMKWKKASDDEHIPDEVKVVLQHYNGSEWTNVETVTLNAANNWKASFAPVQYQSADDANKYRIRELNKDDIVILDKDDDYGSDVPSSIFNVDGNETGYLVNYVRSGMTTTITNSSCKVYSVEKKWDTDIETAAGKQDRPDELQVVLQKRDNWFSWKAVEILTLNRDNNWSGEFQPVAAGYVNAVGTYVEYKYRVRELEAEEEDENGQPPQYNTDEERLNAADDRVVYDKWDLDKPFWKNVIEMFKDPDTWIHFEPEMDQVKDWAKDILIPSPSVEFKVKEYTDFYGVNVEEHTTKYNVKYEHDSSTHKMKITNLAVLDAKVHSWWLNFQDYTDEETGETKNEKPESCYVMLESKIKKDYRDKIGEAGEYADIYTPCFSTVSGGYSLDKLPGVSDLKDGVKTGIKKLMGDGFIGTIGSAALDEFVLGKISSYLQTGVAIAKQDGKAENPLNRWYTTFTVKKYGMGEFKLPMDYAATELVTGLIEMILDAAIKYFGIQNVHVPVMYQPIDQYWSIKGYGINLGDTLFLCNIINIKFHRDDDNLGTVVSGMKYWKDDKEEDRPDSIKIHVYYKNDEGEKIELTGSPVTVNKSDNSGNDSWPWSIEIPLGDDASKVDKDSFIIEEESVSGYDTSVSGYDITNTKSSSSDPTEAPTEAPTDPTAPTDPPGPGEDTGKLKITATRGASDKEKEQSYIYEVTGPDNIALNVAVVLEKGATSGSVTIAKLPPGEYTVTEKHSWSWRYNEGGEQSATVETGTDEVTFEYTKENNNWLNGYSHRYFE